MFAPLGEIIRNGIAQTTPSGLFFAIGEQLNALSGLALCLIMAWSHMDNPRRNGTLFMSIGLVWFLLCGVLCGTLGIPSLWTVIPTAPLVLLVLRWLTELPWRQLLLIVATASYMVAIVYYLSLVIDVAVLGADSTNLRVGWRDWSICCCLTSSHWSRFGIRCMIRFQPHSIPHPSAKASGSLSGCFRSFRPRLWCGACRRTIPRCWTRICWKSRSPWRWSIPVSWCWRISSSGT